MRALRLERFGTADKAFEFVDIDDPEIGADDVLIDVTMSGLNFADVMARQGLYDGLKSIPAVIGFEVVGKVSAIGASVQNVAVGERVASLTPFGGYASKLAAPAAGVLKVPASLSDAQATALATQYVTAWHSAVDMVNLYPGDFVMVQAAAGGVGIALCQIALQRGCVVFGTAGSDEKVAFLRELGVHHAINYRSDDFRDKVREITGERGLDVVFDSVGGDIYKHSVECLGVGGRMVSFGAASIMGAKRNYLRVVREAVKFGLINPLKWMNRSHSYIGVNLLELGAARPDIVQRCMAGISEGVVAGYLTPVVDSVYPVERFAEAHERLGTRKTMGKVALDWTGTQSTVEDVE